MGREYALLLSKQGYGIAAVDRDARGLEKLGAELGQGSAFVSIAQDLSCDDAVPHIRKALTAAGADHIAILVNNAGFIFTTEICCTPPEKLRAMMMVHCVTPLLLCREFVPGMKAVGRGYVLNISSLCAWMAWPAIGMYGNTKRFVKAYSRSLRLECRCSGVSVTTAIFGAVDTPLFGFSDRTRRTMRRLGFMITPERAAERALRAMFRGRRSIVPGIGNKLLIPLLPLLPDCLISALYRRFGKYLNSGSGTTS